MSDFIIKQNVYISQLGFEFIALDNTIGIFRLNDEEKPELVSPFAVFPTKATRVMNDASEETRITVNAFYNQRFLTPLSVCGNCNEKQLEKLMLKVWGPVCVPEMTKENRSITYMVFRFLCTKLEYDDIYECLSWRDHFSQYVYGTLLIDRDGIKRITSNCTKYRDNIEESTKEELETYLRDDVFSLTRDKEYPITLVLMQFLGIVYQRLQETEISSPGFALAVIGETGCRKTSSIKAICNPMCLEQASFEDTEKSLIQNLKRPMCGCFIIDDFNVKTPEKTKKFEMVIRLIGDDTTNRKKMIGNKIDNTVIPNMCILNGEHVPELTESSFTRVLLFELNQDTILNSVLTGIQNSSSKMIELTGALIQYSMKLNISEDFSAQMLEQRRRIVENSEDKWLHGRYVDMAAWLITAWLNLCSIFPTIKTIDYPAMVKKRILNQQKRFLRNSIDLFVEALFELINRNVISIGSNQDRHSVDIIEDGERWFLKSGDVYGKILNFCLAEYNITTFDSEKKIRYQLFKEGLLDANDPSTLTCQKSHNGVRFSGFYVLKNLLKKRKDEYYES